MPSVIRKYCRDITFGTPGTRRIYRVRETFGTN